MIGFGAPNKAGTAGAHGAPLGAEEIAGAREALGPALVSPADSLFAWLPLRAPWRSGDFDVALRRRGVAGTPADVFHVPGAPREEGLRLCFGAAESRKALRQGLDLVAEVLDAGPTGGGAIV